MRMQRTLRNPPSTRNASPASTYHLRTRLGGVNKVITNGDSGYRKLTVEQPLRMNFAAGSARLYRCSWKTCKLEN